MTIQKRTMIFVSDHAFISKWCCNGAIRKMRRPQYLKLTTCSITDIATIAKMPPTKSSSSSTFIMIAIAAMRAAHRHRAGVPHEHLRGERVEPEEADRAPISAAPMKAMSSRFSMRPCVPCERM